MTEEEYFVRKIKLQKELDFYAKHFPKVSAERKRRLDRLEKAYNNK